ncbi:MAG: helix-turn-helix transcriptional regulator [Acidimicrobiia bacterium]|nr:helix-turn-helix transcriptional regulator [Acidimicrobiia bacterium]
MLDLQVIDDPGVAAAALDPMRARILAALREPGSATTVAGALNLTRQKVNYHLRSLEDHGLVQLVEERPRRGLTERIVVASAQSYALSPDVLGDSGKPSPRLDRLSSRYLIAVASELIRDVGRLAMSAATANKPLSTLTIEAEVCLATATDRNSFAKDLADAVAGVCARHHNESARNGRWHRLVVASHPRAASRSPFAPTPPTDDRNETNHG